MLYNALSFHMNLLLFQHSRNGRKTKKKSVKTKKNIKHKQFFPTEVDQNVQTPASNVAVKKKDS